MHSGTLPRTEFTLSSQPRRLADRASGRRGRRFKSCHPDHSSTLLECISVAAPELWGEPDRLPAEARWGIAGVAGAWSSPATNRSGPGVGPTDRGPTASSSGGGTSLTAPVGRGGCRWVEVGGEVDQHCMLVEWRPATPRRRSTCPRRGPPVDPQQRAPADSGQCPSTIGQLIQRQADHRRGGGVRGDAHVGSIRVVPRYAASSHAAPPKRLGGWLCGRHVTGVKTTDETMSPMLLILESPVTSLIRWARLKAIPTRRHGPATRALKDEETPL